MKKALVLAIVMVLGLGLSGFAQGVLEGVWDTDISLYPAAGEFGDFIKSFTSEVDVDFTVGCFTFGVETTFGLAGLTGVDFDVEGTLGAFTLSGEIGFLPTVLVSTATAYSDIQTVSACAGLVGIAWGNKTVTNTYTGGFGDMELVGSVSIAGIDLEALFYLDGEDEVSYTVTGLYGTVGLSLASVSLSAADPITVYNSVSNGAGWRLLASGSCGGATLTGRAYFNIEDYWGSLGGYYGVYGLDYPLSYLFAESGDWSIVCDDCISRFTGLQVLVEDLSFACVDFSAMVSFDCCGFNSAKFLIEDIGLGCCWDIGFDMMVTFTTLTKSIEIDPSITLANSCFTISAGLDASGGDGGAAFTLSGIEIYGIGIDYAFNGLTFTSKTSWNLSKYPILGSAYYGGATFSPTKIHVLEPDIDYTVVTFDEDCAVDQFTPAVSTDFLGWWQVKSFSCEKALAWEMFGIDYSADACCGGAFSASADFYFGDIEELTALGGSYFYYAAEAFAELVFYGDGFAGTDPVYKAWKASTSCDCCPCDEADCTHTVDAVKWTSTYTAKAANRLFDWVETDVDVEIGLGSNFDLTFGLDVTCWGWEDFTFGFELTF